MSHTALRIAGRVAALLAIVFLLTVVGVVIQRVIGWDAKFLVGWWSCLVTAWLFPSMWVPGR